MLTGRAFGRYGAEDMTRVYVDDWDECLERRAAHEFAISEKDLGAVGARLGRTLADDLTSRRSKQRHRRRANALTTIHARA